MSKYKSLGELTVPPHQAYTIYSVRPCMVNGPWIGGGAVRQWLRDEDVISDVDVYFRNFKQLKTVEANLQKIGYNTFHQTDNARTMRLSEPAKVDALPVQLIVKDFFNNPNEILDSFDLAQSQLISDGYVAYGNEQWNNNFIIIDNFKPETILKRLVKYNSYGYKIKPGELERMAEDEKMNYDFIGTDDYV